jgi:hypothetical protein
MVLDTNVRLLVLISEFSSRGVTTYMTEVRMNCVCVCVCVMTIMIRIIVTIIIKLTFLINVIPGRTIN